MAKPRRAGGLKVLVAEDDEADAYLIRRVIDRHPNVAAADFAIDGVEALRAMTRNGGDYDLAIVDLHMPRMDGFRFLLEFGCRHGRRFPIVVLTSSSTQRDAVRSLCRGATQVISKPESLEDLERALGDVLDA